MIEYMEKQNQTKIKIEQSALKANLVITVVVVIESTVATVLNLFL